MTKRSKSYREELLASLKDNEEAVEYLQAALEDSHGAFLIALKNVLDARKLAAVARASNLSREHLYSMLTEDGNPTLNSLERILHALGLRLAIGLGKLDSSDEGATIDYMQSQEDVPDSRSWSCDWHLPKKSDIEMSAYQFGVLQRPGRSDGSISRKTKLAVGGRKSAGRQLVALPVSVRETEDCFEMAY
jgi:probable addiction module antidote protein